jgi:transcriptional regulator with XRE-family HTH domain
MHWTVVLVDEFEEEFDALHPDIQDELLSRLKLLEQFGPNLGRPNVDTLYDSSFPNMKELRFRLDGLWRFVFAFDAQRQAVVLVGGNKEGENQGRFYRDLIKTADDRFGNHLKRLKQSKQSK